MSDDEQDKEKPMVDRASLATEIATLKGEVGAIRADLSDIKERIRGPKLTAIVSAGGTAIAAATVLLAIGTMALKPVAENVAELNKSQIRLEDELKNQISETRTYIASGLSEIAQSHARWQDRLIIHAEDGHPIRVIERLQEVDDVHTEEHTEQEEDIGELRASDLRFESRIDNLVARITAAEAKIQALEGKIVGRTSGGFHREDYEEIVKPWLKRLEEELREIRMESK